MMTLDELKASVSDPGPPDALSDLLQALWFAAKDDWHRAHEIVQAENGADAAWVHAYLHRVEGDLSNACYWYGRAGRHQSDAALAEEWSQIATALLGD